jgi:cytochrome b
MSNENRAKTKEVYVWDFPTRLFHWLLALMIVLLVVTGKAGGNALEWHERCGYITLGLLLFRVLWGFIGNRNARFANFLRGPAAVLRYLKGLTQSRSRVHVGHNPAGGWSVIAMLLIVAAQVGTGLFANDDVMLEGPLAYLVSKDLSDQLTGMHEIISNFLLAIIGLHIAAIALYYFVKKDNLVMPMISGRRRISQAKVDDRKKDLPDSGPHSQIPDFFGNTVFALTLCSGLALLLLEQYS